MKEILFEYTPHLFAILILVVQVALDPEIYHLRVLQGRSGRNVP